MDWLRDYLLSIICASMICALLTRFVKTKGTVHAVTKLLCGVFIAYTLVKPLPSVNLQDFSKNIQNRQVEAQQAVELGENISRDALEKSIKKQTESYILEKARQLNLDVQVEVEMTVDQIPVPKAVFVCGKVSPYAKKKLSAIIEDDIGIDMGNQKWN